MLYAMAFAPVAESGEWVVHVPAFAEEMNKARRMVFLQASAFARAGFGVLVIDLYGTGDSAGDFGDARWDAWKGDLDVAIEYAKSRGAKRVALWGLRLGCLLAADVIAMCPASISRLLLWQPVISGQVFLAQFLRLRIAAQMGEGSKQDTVKSLRATLLAGTPIEVAGYRLRPDLAARIEALDLADLVPPRSTRVAWFDVVDAPGAELGVAGRRVIDRWQGDGIALERRAHRGDRFWSTQEIALVPSLIGDTTQALCRAVDDPLWSAG